MKQGKIAALLAALLLLVGCGSDTTSADTDAESQIPTDTGTETVIETEPIDPIEARTLQDDVPELDFGGVPFRTIVQQSCVDDIWVESAIGEVLNDAVFDRNMKIQERFNIVIEATPMDYSDISSVIRKAVSAGDDRIYDCADVCRLGAMYGRWQ